MILIDEFLTFIQRLPIPFEPGNPDFIIIAKPEELQSLTVDAARPNQKK